MTKIRASKCVIREVSQKEERAFLDAYHYQGFIPSKWCKGLYYNDELVCLMSFGTPRYNKRYDWELLRLCSKADVQVYGGASRLLKNFTNNNSGSIISYCNKSKFSGKVYEAIGFTYQATCASYHYEKDGKSYHRSNFQKWRCLQLWPQYVGTDYTESKIMAEQGYIRVDEKQAIYTIGDKWYIYRIDCNGYSYIGQHLYNKTTDDSYKGSGTIIKRLTAKYPFKKTILLDNITSQKEADKYEKCAIFMDKVGNDKNVNILSGGHQPRPLQPNRNHTYNISDDTRTKLSKCSKEMWQNMPEQQYNDICQRRSEIMKDIRAAKKWSSNGMAGKSHSEETKQHLSDTLKGRKFSEEHNAKVAVSKKEYWKEHSIKIKCNETGEILTRQEWLDKGYASIDRAARTGNIYKGFTFTKCELG